MQITYSESKTHSCLSAVFWYQTVLTFFKSMIIPLLNWYGWALCGVQYKIYARNAS